MYDEVSDTESEVFQCLEPCPKESYCPTCHSPIPSPLYTVCKYEGLLEVMEKVICDVQEMTKGYSKTELRILMIRPGET